MAEKQKKIGNWSKGGFLDGILKKHSVLFVKDEESEAPPPSSGTAAAEGDDQGHRGEGAASASGSEGSAAAGPSTDLVDHQSHQPSSTADAQNDGGVVGPVFGPITLDEYLEQACQEMSQKLDEYKRQWSMYSNLVSGNSTTLPVSLVSLQNQPRLMLTGNSLSISGQFPIYPEGMPPFASVAPSSSPRMDIQALTDRFHPSANLSAKNCEMDTVPISYQRLMKDKCTQTGNNEVHKVNICPSEQRKSHQTGTFPPSCSNQGQEAVHQSIVDPSTVPQMDHDGGHSGESYQTKRVKTDEVGRLSKHFLVRDSPAIANSSQEGPSTPASSAKLNRMDIETGDSTQSGPSKQTKRKRCRPPGSSSNVLDVMRTKEKQFECSKCGRKFSLPGHLNYHVSHMVCDKYM